METIPAKSASPWSRQGEQPALFVLYANLLSFLGIRELPTLEAGSHNWPYKTGSRINLYFYGCLLTELCSFDCATFKIMAGISM